MAPFCASCHASRSEAALAGAPGQRATKELAANKHLAQIEKGEGGYADLSEADRATLVQQIQALDEATRIEMTAPKTVKAGETFTVTVDLTGGTATTARGIFPNLQVSKAASSVAFDGATTVNSSPISSVTPAATMNVGVVDPAPNLIVPILLPFR